jgi:xylulokinase
MAASGSIVKWFKNLLGGRQNSYAVLDKGAGKVPSGSDGLVVLPYFLGEKTPIFDPLARGVVFGLGLHHTKHHLHRAILEAVVYGFRHHAELIRDMGYPIRRVLAVDQGARSAVWRQIAADVLGADIHRVQGGDMGSVYGTAFVAGVAARFWSWEDLPRFTRVRIANHPNRENQQRYDQTYRLYRDLYRHLKADFQQLHQIRG